MSTPQTPIDLAVVITTLNNRHTIERTLESVSGLAGRIVVVDSGSDDGTIECCRSHGAEVIHRDWTGPGEQKQFAIEQCGGAAWILLLDSDESLEPPLRDSIRRTLIEDDAEYDGWEFNRRVFYRGGWLRYTFQPEWRLRLIRGSAGRVIGIGAGGVHERVEVTGRVGRLAGDCRHDSWTDLIDLGRRNLQWAKSTADGFDSGGTLLHVIFSPPAAFAKQYLLKRGFLDGWRGLVLAGAMASYALMKHLFIAERRATRE